MRYTWDEAKRLSNLAKHGFDFKDAGLVYDSPHKQTTAIERRGEARMVDTAMVALLGTVLLIAYVERENEFRIISFRRASRKERSSYEAKRRKSN